MVGNLLGSSIEPIQYIEKKKQEIAEIEFTKKLKKDFPWSHRSSGGGDSIV